MPRLSRQRGDELTVEKMKKCVWLRPEAVAQVEFLEWAEGDRLRHYTTAMGCEVGFTPQGLQAAGSLEGIEKTRIVTPGNLIRAYAAMFLGEPHRTTRNYAALLEGVGKDIFAPDQRLEPYYVAAFALYRLEYFFRNQSLDAKYKPARFHILLASRLLADPSNLPRPNSHDMQRYCDKIAELFWDVGEAETLFNKAAATVDAVAKGNFHRDFIRTQPFTESLMQQCKPTPTRKR